MLFCGVFLGFREFIYDFVIPFITDPFCNGRVHADLVALYSNDNFINKSACELLIYFKWIKWVIKDKIIFNAINAQRLDWLS